MMKINWIEFEDLETGLKCNRVTFYDDVTLLVGLSGVGKSQILNAIVKSFNYATNDSEKLHPFSATINFTINSNEYEWSYKIDKVNVDLDNMLNKKLDNGNSEFVFEELKCNHEQIMARNRDGNFRFLSAYTDFPVPKSTSSLLSQYSSDPNYEDVISDFKKIAPLDMDIAVRGLAKRDDFLKIISLAKTIIKGGGEFDIFRSSLVIVKLYLVKRYFKDIYVKIYDYVKELFPEITDIDVVEDKNSEAFVVSIDVYNKKLFQENISNGMLKTIYYIVELVTTRPNTLVLIDEFENGLGVNCIDVLAELLLSEREDLQFIITSHHPKIIGQIPSEKWKIIEREYNIINNITSDEAGIGNSKHSAYFNLINRWEYEGKI